MRSGAIKFESVAISDTTAEKERIGRGGRSGRRWMLLWCAERWRGDDVWRVCRVQGRQHRTLYSGALFSLLTVACVAWRCMGWVVTLSHGVWCMLHLVGYGACCRLYAAASGVVHVARCTFRVVRCMLRNTSCICASAVFVTATPVLE
jgi:hypothetical protein